MPTHILVNGLGLTYKSTIGLSTATIPDICKTPSPAGPVPIPYPNIATQSSLKGGTTTVKAKGKMIAVKGSQYGSSNGDEAGTAGGVKSSVNMKATDWITYSFDVKMDGKNACRHTDKKFHNNQNTVNLAGGIDPNNPPVGLTPHQAALWKPCIEQHEKYDEIKKENKKMMDDWATTHGETPKQTKAKIFSNSASAVMKSKYEDLLCDRIELFERMDKERQKYVDMDCDDIPWPGGKPTKADRKAAHDGEIANNKQNIKNLWDELGQVMKR